ncbi:MAG: COG4223 family protein, partial [Hyphomicrobiaceae bacterium]
QLDTLRKSLMSEMDTRIAQTADVTAKAVAGAERLDREVAEIKTDTARLDQRATVLKTASDKLAASTRAISEQSAQLKVELDGLKGDVKQELAKVARPGDVEQAIAPVNEKVAAIEKNLGSVLASETARKANAERIVLSLELSKLKRVLDRGQPYGAELADVKKIAGDAVDFAALDAHKEKGVASGAELTRRFNTVAYKIIDAQNAPKDASRINRLLAAAKSIVQVRRTDLPAEEKTAEAAVARIEKQLKSGDLSGALALAEKLPDEAKTPARDWIGQLAARAGVDRAIATIEDQLKASLGGSAENKS